MANRLKTKGGTYLYAVVAGAEERDVGPFGLYDSKVYTVVDGDVSAVVSELPDEGRLRPERRHLSAHQRVLSRLIEENNAVLPVSFGTVADTPDSIRKMLDRYHEDLIKQIVRVRDKVEMELIVTWEVPNVFEYFLEIHPELKGARDELYSMKREPTRDEKIELGQMFERFLEDDREAYTHKVEKVLAKVCSETKRNKCRNEREVMRLSCLVEREAVEGLKKALDEASRMFDDNYTFEYTGPYPPFNFVELHIEV